MNEKRKIDNNFSELLQEFRVAQLGIQILFAFLLSLPFQSRFNILHFEYQKWVYACALMSALLSTMLFIAPVSHHRILFHQGLKDVIIDFASLLAQIALSLEAIAMLTSIFLIFTAIFNIWIASIFTFIGALVVIIFWYVMAVGFRRNRKD